MKKMRVGRIDRANFFPYHCAMEEFDLIEEDRPEKGAKGGEKSLSFLEKLLSIFRGNDTSEREKKRLLKSLSKQLKSQRNRFYKPKGEEAQPALAKFFYAVYKLVGPARVFLENAAESGALKTIIIEHFLNDEQLKVIEDVSEPAIRQRADTEDLKNITGQLKERMVTFFSAFDSNKVKNINSLYNLLLTFLKFMSFDYYFLLKKFDSNLPEGDFFYNPKFEAIPGSYVSDDLKDFMELLYVLTVNGPWDTLFDVLEAYRGQNIINREEWQKHLKELNAIRKSNILLFIIKHIDKDPYFQVKVSKPNEKIVEQYLSKIKTNVELSIQKIIQEKRTSKIDKLANAVFGTAAISRMKYYTEKANMAFSKKMLGGFIFINPLNYLKAFLLDFVKKDLKQIVDILLIKGKWSTNVISQKLSDSFHELLELSDKLIDLDESLSEEGEFGGKIKTLLPRIERDQGSMLQLRQIIKRVNETASEIIQTSGSDLVGLGKNLKAVLDDNKTQPHELLMNWKELEAAADWSIRGKVSEVYQKIYYFIQLLQFFSKSS